MSHATKAPPIYRTAADLPPVEVYTDERAAEFLLNAAVDAADHERARQAVRDDFGLDPDAVDHLPPPDLRQALRQRECAATT